MAFFIPFLRLFRLSKAKLSKNAPEFTELECLDLPRLLVFCREIGSTILTDNVGFEYKFVEKTEQECLLGHFFYNYTGRKFSICFQGCNARNAVSNSSENLSAKDRQVFA